MQEFGFECDGVWITNPTVSPCGRFQVNPREFYRVNLCGMSDDALDAWIAEVDQYWEEEDV